MNLTKVLHSGSVVRYHSTLIRDKQNNAEHSWEVAIILMKIYPEASKELLFYALTHDCGEFYTGDIAAPIKVEFPEIKTVLDKAEAEYVSEVLCINHPPFTATEKLAVKYADVLSGIYFTTSRMQSGDTRAAKIRDVWLQYLGRLDYLNAYTEAAKKELLNGG